MSFDPITRPRIEQRALQIALIAHGDQRREYTGQEPYISHCIKSAQFLVMFHQPSITIQAALLQGVLAKTPTSAIDLRTEFGYEVTRIVQEMGPMQSMVASPLAARRLELGRFAHVSEAAQNVKAASLIDDAWHCMTAQIARPHDWPWFFKDMRAYGQQMQKTHPALKSLINAICDSVIIHGRWPDPQSAAIKNIH